MGLSVFDYKSARDFLIDHISALKNSPDFSLRKLSRESGIGSHTLLVMILQKKRTLNPSQTARLADSLGLSTPEKLYLKTLSQHENARDESEQHLYRLLLQQLNPQKPFTAIEVEEFTLIAHWVHMAILSIVELPGITWNAQQVAKRLRFQLTVQEVENAFQRLRSFGLIEQKEGRWSVTYARVTTRDDVSNFGVREYHRQVSELAQKAVEQIAVEEREFQSFTLAMPRSKIPLAKEMIRQFRTQFINAFDPDPEADEVFQCNLQFFPLTDFQKGSK